MLGMLKKHTVELSPEVHGRLSNNKTPISNHKIKRCLIYGDEEYIDEAITDFYGKFQFPSKNIKSRLPGNPLHEPKVQQIVCMEVEEKVYLIWFSNQDGLHINPLYCSYLNNLNADISNEKESFWIDDIKDPTQSYQIHSICRW
ncbi:DUF6795 domain-containing protein [Pseudocolwellia agarivorans]|uniref:DUF6795 domain-containing protein n=1 Tax=Pseudocolwellia agarivorans TaxID=1911682 RepID=UPI00098778A1|nr:DUF6795 domain-containing protein [Pseudocolwellia agarivorans]